MATVKIWLTSLCTDVDKWCCYYREIAIFDLAYNRWIGASPRRAHVYVLQCINYQIVKYCTEMNDICHRHHKQRLYKIISIWAKFCFMDEFLVQEVI